MMFWITLNSRTFPVVPPGLNVPGGTLPMKIPAESSGVLKSPNVQKVIEWDEFAIFIPLPHIVGGVSFILSVKRNDDRAVPNRFSLLSTFDEL